ncbi:hypothetical protein BGI35_00625 [Snodgrassella communis]|nr:hypothetical protein BGI35_00625 [Snodgrassella communis]
MLCTHGSIWKYSGQLHTCIINSYSYIPVFDVGLLVGFSLFLSGILTIFSLSLFTPIIFYKKENKRSQQKLITEIAK